MKRFKVEGFEFEDDGEYVTIARTPGGGLGDYPISLPREQLIQGLAGIGLVVTIHDEAKRRAEREAKLRALARELAKT